MGIVGALQTIPDLVFGMVAGALADRTDRRRMMLLADLGRAVLTALIPLSVLLNGPTMVVVLLVAAPMSVLRSLFLAGYTASVPALVGRSQVARANSVLRGDLLARLHRRPGHRRLPLRGHRAGPDAGHRRGLVHGCQASPVLQSGATCERRSTGRPRRIVADIREGIEYIVGHPLLRSDDPLLGPRSRSRWRRSSRPWRSTSPAIWGTRTPSSGCCSPPTGSAPSSAALLTRATDQAADLAVS